MSLRCSSSCKRFRISLEAKKDFTESRLFPFLSHWHDPNRWAFHHREIYRSFSSFSRLPHWHLQSTSSSCSVTLVSYFKDSWERSSSEKLFETKKRKNSQGSSRPTSVLYIFLPLSISLFLLSSLSLVEISRLVLSQKESGRRRKRPRAKSKGSTRRLLTREKESSSITVKASGTRLPTTATTFLLSSRLLACHNRLSGAFEISCVVLVTG